jgi:RNA polymerase sigma factor (sigma-70 family)
LYGVDVDPIPETNVTNRQDTHLFRRIVAGEESAEDELCRKYRPRVVFLLLRRTFGREEVAEDLAQEAMPALIAAIRDGRLMDPTKIGAYLFGTCSKLAARWRARQARETSLESMQPASADDDPEEQYIETETRARLIQVFMNLSRIDREILSQRFARELSFAEIASNLGLTSANARQRARRAVSKLRDRLETG